MGELNGARLQENSKSFVDTVNEVQRLIQGQIVNLKDYIPSEKTAYGSAKVSLICRDWFYSPRLQ